jgi:hypothetical protein
MHFNAYNFGEKALTVTDLLTDTSDQTFTRSGHYFYFSENLFPAAWVWSQRL